MSVHAFLMSGVFPLLLSLKRNHHDEFIGWYLDGVYGFLRVGSERDPTNLATMFCCSSFVNFLS